MKYTSWLGSQFCSSLPQEVAYNENTENTEKDEFLDGNSRNLHWGTCSANMGDLQEGPQKLLAKSQVCYQPRTLCLLLQPEQ